MTSLQTPLSSSFLFFFLIATARIIPACLSFTLDAEFNGVDCSAAPLILKAVFICLISVRVMSADSAGMSCEAGFNRCSDGVRGLAVVRAPGRDGDADTKPPLPEGFVGPRLSVGVAGELNRRKGTEAAPVEVSRVLAGRVLQEA